MRIIVVIVLLLVAISSQAQCEYLLDSITKIELFLPNTGNLYHVKYKYDSEERVIEIRDEHMISEYLYEENGQTHTEYNGDRTELRKKVIDFFDELGRTERTEIYNNAYLHNYDSLIYSTDGLSSFRYHFVFDLDDDAFYLNLTRASQYDSIGNLLGSQTLIFNGSGNNTYYWNIENIYDEQGRVTLFVDVNNFAFGGENRDSTFMDYNGDELSRQLNRTYYEDEFQYANKNEFFYPEDSLNTWSYRQYESIEHDYILNSVRQTKLSDNCIGSELAGEQKHVLENGQIVPQSIWKNTFDFTSSRDTAFVRKERHHVESSGAPIAVLVANEIWIRTTENPEQILEQIRLYPNPSLPNSSVFINSRVKIDGYLVFDTRGKLIQSISRPGTVIGSLTSPQVNGMYYISFLSEGKIVGKSLPLIVF